MAVKRTGTEEVELDTGYTVVVSDQDILSALCGVNDGNLRTIEAYLGAPLVSRGNELTVASTDHEICRKFQLLMDKLVTGHEQNSDNPERIHALIEGLESYITIPHGGKRLYPKTVHQAELIARLQTHSVVFAIGPAGTGKTYVAVAAAIHLLLTHQVRKLVITRPVVEAGESLGFLPGDLAQKIDPYVRPLYDAMESMLSPDLFKKLIDSRMVEIAPLAYMRGRSIDNSVIILDEAQNTTCEQMKMFLTRMGEGSRIIVTGDPQQSDLPGRVRSGLLQAIEILSKIPEIAFVTFNTRDVVRNSLVKKIVQAYEQDTR